MSELAEILGFSSAQALGLSLLCGSSTLALGLLLLLRPPARVIRLASILFIALGLVGIVMTMERRINHSNTTQYYMGAKYDCAYFDFFKLFVAGRALPQVVYRDLRNPNRMIRVDPRDQRLYLVELFEAAGIPEGPDFDPSLNAEALGRQAEAAGLIEREARSILETRIAPERLADFQRDARAGRMYLDDFGFNGSPLYVLLRKLDPTLYLPYGPPVAIFNTVWQLLMLGLLLWLAARIFAWSREEALLCGALVMVSIDYSGWGLNGLTVAGWLVPVFVALYGYHRGKDWLAGLGIAWATLIKLFPLALVMPLLLLVLRGFVFDRFARDGKSEAGEDGPGPAPHLRALRVLLFTAGFGLLLFGLGALSGTSWKEYLEKIVVQFQHSNYLANGVGLSKLLHAADIMKSDVLLIPQLVMLSALGWIMWIQPRDEALQRLPAISLLLMACMGFVTETWFNYYAIVALFLVPGLLRAAPRWTAGLLILFGICYLLPDYTFTYRSERIPAWLQGLGPALVVLKVLPHLLLPLTALRLEWLRVKRSGEDLEQRDPASRLLYRLGPALVLGGVILSSGLIGWEVYRHRAARTSFAQANQLLAEGALQPAFERLSRCARLIPGDAVAHFNLGAIHEARGDAGSAERSYHTALAHDPEMIDAYNNLGILYIQHGKAGLARAQFERALAVRPWDEDLRVNLGNCFLAEGRKAEAEREYRTALRIVPGYEAAIRMLGRISEHPTDPEE